MDNVGAKIKSRRKLLGMSRAELAAKSGVSEVTIWKLENEKQISIRLVTLQKLVKALNDIVERYI